VDDMLLKQVVRLAYAKPALRKALLDVVKIAAEKTAFSDDTADFVEWCLAKGDRMGASDCKRLLERMGLEMTEAPAPGGGPKRGPLEVGEQVRADKGKNTNSLNVDACEKWHDNVGTIDSIGPDSVVVRFENGAKVQFMGLESGAKSGLYRWTPAAAADHPGRGVIEVVYVSDKTAPPPDKERIEMVEKYVEKGLQKGESRVDVYYTGLPLKMAQGEKGFYFSMFPTQRMTPMAGAHPRSINPQRGHLYYIGILGHRPGGWEGDLAKMRAAMGAAMGAA